MNVQNKKCIRNLSKKSMRAFQTRNWIAIIAIALTTVLFTSLFTITLSINDAFQDSNFRQTGGFNHGGYKYLTKEQFDELKSDSLIKEYGLRRVVGIAEGESFTKSQVEIGYSDENTAHWMYCDPIEGRLPREGTNEAATDLKVLELLGVEPKIGNKFTVKMKVDGKETTQSFILSGYWEYDEIIVANHIILPESRVDAILDELDVVPPGKDGMTGTYEMSVMFSSSMHIEKDLNTILKRHGYQSDSQQKENYIRTGVNWGYTGAQMTQNFDAGTLAAMAVMLLLIIFTGYLIIYNIFQISVINDIRFYGLLKTIGTTKKQIKKIIRQQAFRLSMIGIPIGLILGWGAGRILTPFVLRQLNGVSQDIISLNPIIFIASALFSLITVFLSCSKPGKMAARVSPVEAVKYTEGSNPSSKFHLREASSKRGESRKEKKSKKKFSLFSMARSNIGRNKGKTIVTILSLSLAVVLLELVVIFTNGFDMDKYLRDVVSDFIVADAGYFQVTSPWNVEQSLPESVISDIESQKGVKKGGRVYGKTSMIYEFVTEEYYRNLHGDWMTEEEIDKNLELEERDETGKIEADIELYGMEEYEMEKLKVMDGDISKLLDTSKNYIAAVYLEDDYGKEEPDTNWARVGDKIKLRYVEEVEYYNPKTGEIYKTVPETEVYRTRAKKYREIEYEVAATVILSHALSYRFYGDDQFILNAEVFKKDTKTDNVMLYAYDMQKEQVNSMENFLKKYTESINPQYDYESKESHRQEFESFRSMFFLLGGALSAIVGLIGVLNFLNVTLTGIITRKRELAVLQSVGMTGSQLKKMLVFEGLIYALGSILFALLLTIITGPLLSSVLENMFWFFSYHFTIVPIMVLVPIFILLGILLPLAVYHQVVKKSIVERLRDVE